MEKSTINHKKKLRCCLRNLNTNFSALKSFLLTSVSDPDPYHLAGSGSGSVSGNVDLGIRVPNKNRDKLAYKSTNL